MFLSAMEGRITKTWNQNEGLCRKYLKRKGQISPRNIVVLTNQHYSICADLSVLICEFLTPGERFRRARVLRCGFLPHMGFRFLRSIQHASPNPSLQPRERNGKPCRKLDFHVIRVPPCRSEIKATIQTLATVRKALVVSPSHLCAKSF